VLEMSVAGLAFDLLDHGGGPVRRAAREDDLRAGARELLRGDLADAGVRAGHDEGLVCELGLGHGAEVPRPPDRHYFRSDRQRASYGGRTASCARAQRDNTMQLRMISISVLLAASAWACGAKAKGSEPPAGGAGASLYDRLGGKDAITAVVVDFVEQRVAKDARINAFFATTDI